MDFRLQFAPLLVLCGLVCPALGDGLIFQLPPDGAFVEFRGDGAAEARMTLPKEVADKLPPESQTQLNRKLKLHYTVTLSSVGKLTRAGQPCRWIELRMKSEGSMDGGKTEAVGDHILKVLVPEKYLKRGEDPLDHTILTFFNKKATAEPGFNRIRYELERVRTVFPEPFQAIRQLPNMTIKTPAGTFADCEVIAGETDFDRPLLGEGRWEFENDWQIALHKDAPFGVVEVRCESAGQEIARRATSNLTTKYALTLSRVGTGAKSELAVMEQGDAEK
ncbi:MAG: hypothetical protein WD894_07465 [Pirellulales bacterium]